MHTHARARVRSWRALKASCSPPAARESRLPHCASVVPPRQPPSKGRGLTRGSRAACGLLQEGGKELIGTLVEIHKHFVMMFDECCDGDKDLHTVLKQAYARALVRFPAHTVCCNSVLMRLLPTLQLS